jgi:hypothetical protein
MPAEAPLAVVSLTDSSEDEGEVDDAVTVPSIVLFSAASASTRASLALPNRQLSERAPLLR